MATLKDVAHQAGVSITTTSRALNNHGDVAETTRAHVKQIAEALDYHPNMLARSLQKSRANAIGLVIPLALHRAHDPFWFDFIGGMATACAARGPDLLLSAGGRGIEADRHLQRLLRGRRVDGLLVCDVQREDRRITLLQQQTLPFVAFGRTIEDQNYSYIDVDSQTGVIQAMEHLLELGHRRIAFLGVGQDFGFSHYRHVGYQKALVQAGLAYDRLLVHEGLSEAFVPATLNGLLCLPDPPTAVFVAADFLALALIKAGRDVGLSVPDDLSVVVFDDTSTVRHADPPLTAISQPNRRLGEEAAELLLDRIERPTSPLVHRLIVPSLVVRNSTSPPQDHIQRATG